MVSSCIAADTGWGGVFESQVRRGMCRNKWQELDFTGSCQRRLFTSETSFATYLLKSAVRSLVAHNALADLVY